MTTGADEVVHEDHAAIPFTSPGAFERSLSAPTASATSAFGTATATASGIITSSVTVDAAGTWQVVGDFTGETTADLNQLAVGGLVASSALEHGDLVLDFMTTAAVSYEISATLDAPEFEFSQNTVVQLDGSRLVEAGQTKTVRGELTPGRHTFGASFAARADASGATGVTMFSRHDHLTLTLTPTCGPALATRAAAQCSSCPSPGVGSVTVGLAVAEGCFVERTAGGKGTGVFETSSDAWLGGLHLRPKMGVKLVLDTKHPATALAAEGPQARPPVDWVLDDLTIPAPLAFIKPFLASYKLSMGSITGFERFWGFPPLEGVKAEVNVKWGPGGTSSDVEAALSIEELTKLFGTPSVPDNAGDSLGATSAKATLTFRNNAEALVKQAELVLPSYTVLLFGSNPPVKTGFGGARLTTTGKDALGVIEWSGEATFLFAWESGSQGTLKARVYLRNARVAGAGFSLTGFAVPIGASGWNLAGVEGDVLFDPRFAFNLGVTIETRQVPGLPAPLWRLTGNAKGLKLAALDCPHGANPFAFVGTANMPVLELSGFGKASLSLVICDYIAGQADSGVEIAASGDATFNAPGVQNIATAKLKLTGWTRGIEANVEGSAQITLPVIGIVSGSGIISGRGYGVCGQWNFVSVGFAGTWDQPGSSLTACDLTPFRTPPPATRWLRATGSAITIRSGTTRFGITIHGPDTTAPRVTLTSPTGAIFTTPQTATPLATSDVLIAPIDELATTYVFLKNPAPGAWQITPVDPLTTAIGTIQTATALPPARITGALRTVGAKRRLTWRATPITGQRITLVDHAPSMVTTLLDNTTTSHGAIRFTPRNGAGRIHVIEAIITQNGRPRARVTIATYRLAAPKRPGAITKLAATLRKGALTVKWKKAPRATTYLVTIIRGHTTLLRIQTRRPTLHLTGLGSRRLKVTVTPQNPQTANGPARSITTR